jgi:hypothetical protein
MLRPRIVGRLVLDGDVVLVAEGAELAAEVDDGVEEVDDGVEELDDETDELDGGDLTLKPCEKPLKSVVDGSSPGLSLVSSHANWLLPASGTLTWTSSSVDVHRTKLVKTLWLSG